MSANALPSVLVLATRNPGKVAELRALLQGLPLQVAGLDAFPELEPVEETGDTFRANAELKALACARATGQLALADDSGLVVPALGGAPGVRSARYAGEDATDADNNAKLLAVLRDVAPEHRAARFECCAVLAGPQPGVTAAGEPVAHGVLAVTEGTTYGRILEAPRGDGGFGYDPVFWSDDLGIAFGEASTADKNRISHRGRAMAAMRDALQQLLAD